MKETLAKYVSVAVFSMAAVHAVPQLSNIRRKAVHRTAFGVTGGADRVAMLTAMLSLNAGQQASAKAIFNEEGHSVEAPA